MRFDISLRRLVATPMVALGLSAAGSGVQAQFTMVPVPMQAAVAPSGAESVADYKKDAAKHIYAAFPMRIYRGRLPPLLYGVAIVEIEVDAEGKLVDAQLRRPPAAPEVGPWVLQMIRRAAPFPPPAKLGEKVTFSEIWLVDKGGNFQVDSLTEGQR